MKHFVLFIISCCLLSGTALAQQLIGVRAGYGLHRMQLNVSPAPPQEWIPGLSGGLVFQTLSTRHAGLQLELLLEQKGWHLFPGTEAAYYLEETHLTLPVQTVVKIGRGRLQLVVNGGAYVSYVLQDDVRANGSGAIYGLTYEQQDKQNWQYGLLAGLGPAVRLGKSWLQLEGRFAYTLSNRLEPNLASNSTFNVSQQQAVIVSLHWLTQLSR